MSSSSHQQQQQTQQQQQQQRDAFFRAPEAMRAPSQGRPASHRPLSAVASSQAHGPQQPAPLSRSHSQHPSTAVQPPQPSPGQRYQQNPHAPPVAPSRHHHAANHTNVRRDYGSHDSLHVLSQQQGQGGISNHPHPPAQYAPAQISAKGGRPLSTHQTGYGVQVSSTSSSSSYGAKASSSHHLHQANYDDGLTLDQMDVDSSHFQRGEPTTSSMSSLSTTAGGNNGLRSKKSLSVAPNNNTGVAWKQPSGASAETSPRQKKRSTLFSSSSGMENGGGGSQQPPSSSYSYVSSSSSSSSVSNSVQQQQQHQGPTTPHQPLSTKQSKSLFKKLRSVGGGNSGSHHMKEDSSLVFPSEGVEPISAWNPSSSKPSNSSSSHHQSLPASSNGSGAASSASSNGGGGAKSMEEHRHRRKHFLHHDVGSVMASSNIAVRAAAGTGGGANAEEYSNITTGASAASAALRKGEQDGTADFGDHVSNVLVLSCPYFRNEVGGERERRIYLARSSSLQENNNHLPGGLTNGGVATPSNSPSPSTPLVSYHSPQQSRGFSVFNAGAAWRLGNCPYELSQPNVVELRDQGVAFYKESFVGREHQNWLGVDENLGPVAISVRRDRTVHAPADPLAIGAPPTTGNANNGNSVSDWPSDHEVGPPGAMTTSEHHQQTSSSSAPPPPSATGSSSLSSSFLYRLIVRTSSLLSLRGSVPEEAIGNLKADKAVKHLPAKEVLEFVCPEVNLSSLRLASTHAGCEEELLKLDEAYVQNKYKVGLMYCRDGQQSEEDMYNNEHGSAAFNEFLDLIGQRVRLKGFEKYKAGLCAKNDSTGQYSVYREFRGNEVMFHVSTLLPFTASNRQQLPRKRYIGNDIVTIVFQEAGAKPFIPNIKSQFQHVFIIVRVENPCSNNTAYSVAVSRSKSVPLFGPPLPSSGRFEKGSAFADFLLTKILNGENAAHRSDKFVSMAVRTRRELLKDLASTYATQTSLDTGSKLSLFLGKKKEKAKPRFSPDLSGLCGALSWTVVVEDCNVSGNHSSASTATQQNGGSHYLSLGNGGHQAPHSSSMLTSELEVFLAISADTLLILRPQPIHEILFITAVGSVIGWTATPKFIRIYFHQGEAIIIHSKDPDSDDMLEIAQTLKASSHGAATQEFSLRRNQLGQLGFHVQHDGLITEVESFGYAWQTGLRQGSRLVEINKFPVSAISHEHMVELLKTSMSVSVTVIPPHPNGAPRKGCNNKNCAYAFGAEIQKEKAQQQSSPSSTSPATASTAAGGPDAQQQQQEWYEMGSGSSDYLHSSASPPPSLAKVAVNAGYSEHPTAEQRAREEEFLKPKTPSSYEHPAAPSTRRPQPGRNSADLSDHHQSSSSHARTASSNHDSSHPASSSAGVTTTVLNAGMAQQAEHRQPPVKPQSHWNRRGAASSTPSSSNSSTAAGPAPTASHHPTTLQQNLIKLIAPADDDEDDDDDLHDVHRRYVAGREAGGEMDEDITDAAEEEQTVKIHQPVARIVTGAPPSSSSSSPLHAAQQQQQQQQQQQPPSANRRVGTPSSLMDWNQLVKTASELSEDNPAKKQKPQQRAYHSQSSSPSTLLPSSVAVTDLDAASSDADVRILLQRVSQLESQLSSQARAKSSLEEEVEALRGENVRLREESETASQQLKKFTEWFFQAIEKKED